MIDTDALRSKVIDLAIQGKLTEQLPTDGNAEELYQQIQAEKAKLIKEKKIKKAKPLPEISADEIPFEIPDNWKWVRLRDVCRKIVDGDHNPPAGINESTEYMMLSAKNINDDRIIDIENARYLTKEVFEEENKRTNLEIGDVLLTIVATLGRSCVYREKYNVCFQRSVCVITTLLDSDFLKRVFDAGFIQKLMVEGATGAAQPGFYLNKVEKMCIPVPPLSEQKRIVAKVDEVLAEIKIIDELQSQYASNVDVLKSKIIDAGIRGQLTDQLPEDGTAEELYQQIQAEKAQLIKDKKIKKEKPLPEITADEIPFDIPDNWKWVRLGDITINKDSERIPLSVAQRAKLKKNYDYYGASGIIDKVETYIFDVPLLLIGEDGANLLSKSKPVAFIATGKYWVNNHAHVLDMYDGISIIFLMHYINSISLVPYVTGTAQPKINQDNLNKIVVPLPPLSEQKRIVAKIDDVFGALDE